jgi:hypothetical protein
VVVLEDGLCICLYKLVYLKASHRNIPNFRLRKSLVPPGIRHQPYERPVFRNRAPTSAWLVGMDVDGKQQSGKAMRRASRPFTGTRQLSCPRRWEAICCPTLDRSLQGNINQKISTQPSLALTSKLVLELPKAPSNVREYHWDAGHPID